jgi:tRNA uridine 5-carboxymethylaminomethyl modification enzyme
VDFAKLSEVWQELENTPANIIQQLEIEAHYSGYLSRQKADIIAFKKEEQMNIPESVNYANVSSLSNEIREKLTIAKPVTLGAASRIPGITPAAITALMVHIKKTG